MLVEKTSGIELAQSKRIVLESGLPEVTDPNRRFRLFSAHFRVPKLVPQKWTMHLLQVNGPTGQRLGLLLHRWCDPGT